MQPASYKSIGLTFLSFATCASAALTIFRQLTLSVEGSPVRTSATPGSEPELMASVAHYGLSSPESLASYDLAMCLWRTSQLCLDGEWEEFSETWPRSGTMRSGTAYRLPTLAPR